MPAVWARIGLKKNIKDSLTNFGWNKNIKSIWYGESKIEKSEMISAERLRETWRRTVARESKIIGKSWNELKALAHKRTCWKTCAIDSLCPHRIECKKKIEDFFINLQIVLMKWMIRYIIRLKEDISWIWDTSPCAPWLIFL